MKKFFKIVLIVGVIIVGGIFAMSFIPGFGGKIKGGRLERIKQSPNFKDGIFQNPVETNVQLEDASMFKIMIDFMKGGEGRVPNKPIEVSKINRDDFGKGSNGLNVTWLGHSSLLIEIDGTVILTDPVFSKRTSPISFMGTKRFDYTHQFTVEDLPQVDLVLISHDHYDHLDRRAILVLNGKVKKFVTALGVGSHLEKWGVSPDDIVELDWWDSHAIVPGIQFVATPARHFSGRGLTNRFSTLWASFVIKSKNHSVFFGADSGYFPGFKEIGEKYGPFDVTMLECGQYNDAWPNIHMAPEETVQAHLDLKGQALLPIHWGKYSLSLHAWTEPVERLLVKANKESIRVITPQIGKTIQPNKYTSEERWWK